MLMRRSDVQVTRRVRRAEGVRWREMGMVLVVMVMVGLWMMKAFFSFGLLSVEVSVAITSSTLESV